MDPELSLDTGSATPAWQGSCARLEPLRGSLSTLIQNKDKNAPQVSTVLRPLQPDCLALLVLTGVPQKPHPKMNARCALWAHSTNWSGSQAVVFVAEELQALRIV